MRLGRPVAAVLLLLALMVLLSAACEKHPILAPAPQGSPVCEAAPDTLDFGRQALGAPGETLTFRVKNSGGGTLVARVGGVCGVFQVTCGCGNLALGAGDSQAISVRFAPTKLGYSSCTFAIGDSSLYGGVVCVGTAVRPAACRLSVASLAFGDIRVDSCSAVQSFNITNVGEALLQGSVPDSAGAFQVTAGAGPFALAIGETRTVSVRFCPWREGAASADLAFGSATCAVRCSGSGTVPAPTCNVSATGLEYGTVLVGSCSERTFRILNVGVGTLTGSVPASCGPFQVVSGAGPFSLGSGAVDTVTVRFCPTSQTRSDCQLALGLSCAPVQLTGSGGCRPKLAIVSTPSMAHISLDGVAQTCVTPCTLTVTAGTHSVSVSRLGYSYFAGPATVSMPCAGTVTASYVGHHRKTYAVDEGTWLDPAAPSANHCRDTIMVLGPSGRDSARVALLRASSLPSADLRIAVTKATLQLYCVSCSGQAPSGTLAVWPAEGAWDGCTSTWASPGTSWGDGPGIPGVGWSQYTQFDVTASVTAWLAGASANRGWAVVPTNPAYRQSISSPLDPGHYPLVELDWYER